MHSDLTKYQQALRKASPTLAGMTTITSNAPRPTGGPPSSANFGQSRQDATEANKNHSGNHSGSFDNFWSLSNMRI